MITLVVLFDLHINLHLYRISNLLLFVATGLIGSMGLLLLSYDIQNRLIQRIGTNSLGVMVVHYPFAKMITTSGLWQQIAYGHKLLLSIPVGVLLVSFSLCATIAAKAVIQFRKAGEEK